MVAIIDADSLIYKSGFSFEEKTTWNEIELSLGKEVVPDVSLSSDLLLAKNAIDATIENIKFKTGCDDVELWVTGKGNFRYNELPTYKGNRVNVRKPLEYQNLYNYLLTKYQANCADGVEADDVVVWKKTTLPLNYILCAVDKDVLYQTVGCHYNYGRDEFVTVSEKQALRFFWFQVLTGDSVDGYKGCKGTGKVKANKILEEAEDTCFCIEAKTLDECYYEEVLKSYVEAGHSYDYFIATCRVASMHQIVGENNKEFLLNLFK